MRVRDPRLFHGALVVFALMGAGLSWQRGYQPAARACLRDRADLATLTAQLARFNAIVHHAGGQAAWMAQQQPRLSTLQRRVPDQSQLPQVLNALVEAFKAGDIRVLDVAQANPQPVQDDGAPLLLDGKTCYRLPVTVSADGRYHALLAVLDRVMADAFPSLVSLDHIELRTKSPGLPQLHATLTLSLYVTGTTPLVAPAAPSGSAS